MPVELVYREVYDRIDEAFHREKQVLGWTRKMKIALIEDDFFEQTASVKKVFREQ